MKTRNAIVIVSSAAILLMGVTACSDKKMARLDDETESELLEQKQQQKEEQAATEAEADKKEKKYEAGVGELGLFDLRGPVKKFVKQDAFGRKYTCTFDEKGFWKTEDGQSLKEVFYAGITRDKKGRITEGNTDNYFTQFYEWKSNGLIKASWGGGSSSEYFYDEEGNLVKLVVTIDPDMGSDDNPEAFTYIYTTILKDKYGNWTKRKDQKGKIEERTIEYYTEN